MKAPSRRTAATGPGPLSVWDRLQPLLWVLAAIGVIAPLWSVRDLPMVDLPQHLYALDVMARLHDPATAYARWFTTGFHPTPYLGYYATVHLLDVVLPLEVANKVFLSAMVLAWPLAVGTLLRSLGRPVWPALLVAPCAYSDSFGWGFINTLAGMAMALFALAAFTALYRRAATGWSQWSITAALGLGTLAMHPVPLLIIAAGAPLVVLMLAHEPSPRPWFVRAGLALSAWSPAVVLAALWAWSLSGSAPAGASAMPHESFAANLQAFPWLLGNVLRDGSQGPPILLATAIALIACGWRLASKPAARTAPRGAGFVMPLLALLALIAYFMLPVSIQPHIQYLSPRFAPLAAALIWASVPRMGTRGQRLLSGLALAVPLLTAAAVYRGFQQFDAEAGPWHVLAADVPPRSTILNLPYDTGSETIHHPVFLHGAAEVARLTGGIPSYSLAGWAQSPFHWRGAPLPAAASEWNADGFDLVRDGNAYDVILMRGGQLDRVPDSWADSAHRVVRTLGSYTLFRRSSKEPL